MKKSYFSRISFKIFLDLKNRKNLSYKQCINIAKKNIYFANQTKECRFYKLANFFYCKAYKNTESLFIKSTILLKIILNCLELEQFKCATSYMKLLIKCDSNNKDIKLYYKTLLLYKTIKNANVELFNDYKTLMIFLLSQNKFSKAKNYIWIGDSFSKLAEKTNKKFGEIAIFFYKKALNKTKNKKCMFQICMKIQNEFFNIEKYYYSIGYTKIAMKHATKYQDIAYCKESIAINYFLLKKYEKSIKYYAELLNSKEVISKSKLHFAIALNSYELKNFKMATEHIKIAYSLDPTNKEIQEIYNRIIK